jgi:hypothetical protein
MQAFTAICGLPSSAGPTSWCSRLCPGPHEVHIIISIITIHLEESVFEKAHADRATSCLKARVQMACLTTLRVQGCVGEQDGFLR